MKELLEGDGRFSLKWFEINVYRWDQHANLDHRSFIVR
jgi:hypothetical protein